MAKETKVFMDPVHGLIMFDKVREKVLLDLIETPEFQRLRRIRQLGVAWVAFHGAVHTRFSHSLGVCHLAGKFMDRLFELYRYKPFGNNEEDFFQMRLLVRCAALLHDIGHGPFSHVFEGAIENLKEDYNLSHEKWSKKIITDANTSVNQVLKEHGINPEDVIKIIDNTYPNKIVAAIVSSQSDVDRLDYIQRDSLFTGVRYGLVDQDWIIHSLRYSTYKDQGIIAIDYSKGLNSIESFIMARRNLFQQVYYHHKIRSAEIHLEKIFTRLCTLILEDDSTFDFEPLINFIKAPVDLIDVKTYLSLNDFILLSELEKLSTKDSDFTLKELTTDFVKNSVFKSESLASNKLFELKEIMNSNFINNSSGELDPQYYYDLDQATKTYYENIYSKARTSKENDEQNEESGNEIWIINEKEEINELSVVSQVVKSLLDRKVNYRVCFDSDRFDRDKIREMLR